MSPQISWIPDANLKSPNLPPQIWMYYYIMLSIAWWQFCDIKILTETCFGDWPVSVWRTLKGFSKWSQSIIAASEMFRFPFKLGLVTFGMSRRTANTTLQFKQTESQMSLRDLISVSKSLFYWWLINRFFHSFLFREWKGRRYKKDINNDEMWKNQAHILQAVSYWQLLRSLQASWTISDQ